MTKKNFIKTLATKQDVTQTKALSMFDDMKSIIKDELIAGNKVVLGSDFGTFKPTSRTGTLPMINKPYSSKSTKFVVSKPFKRELQ